jgi:hypothetical protein
VVEHPDVDERERLRGAQLLEDLGLADGQR